MNVEQATVERPVFVANHPWRRRGLVAAVAGVGALLAAWLVAIVVGVLGFGSLPILPVPGKSDERAPQLTTSEPGAAGVLGKPRAESGVAGATVATGPKPAQTADQTGATTAQGSSSQAAASGAGQGTGSTATSTASPDQSSPTISSSTVAEPTTSGQAAGGTASTETASGGSQAPDLTPSGNVPAGNAHGSNPNAGGSSAPGLGRSGQLKSQGQATTG